MRDYVLVYINGKRHEVRGKLANLTLANYLRYEKELTGTKVVCAEGDCGACSTLVAPIHKLNSNKLQYTSMNSCISFMYLLDCSHIITVEGIANKDGTHSLQTSMMDSHGAQCGYCTPGFVCAISSLVEDAITFNKPITEQKAKNYLTGNLCRCTGYAPIIEACTHIKLEQTTTMSQRYHDDQMISDLQKHAAIPLKLSEAFLPTTIDDALDYYDEETRVVAGATDLGVVYNKGRLPQKKMLSLKHLKNNYKTDDFGDEVFIGPGVTLTDFEHEFADDFPEFTRMLHIFASPQIKNRATIIGNVINASPIADSIPFLVMNDAKVCLLGKKGGREVVLKDFYQGYKKLDIHRDEIVIGLKIPKENKLTKLYKVSVRKDLDISCVTFAGSIEIENEKIKSLKLSMGGVGPIVFRLSKIESSFIGKAFKEETFNTLSLEIKNHISPISDLRASSDYRYTLAKNLVMKFYHEIKEVMA